MFACSLHPLPLSSLRGFEFVEKDALHPMVGRFASQTVVKTLYKYGQLGHPLVRTIKKMFYTHTLQENPQHSIIGFYGARTPSELGWLAALSQRGDLKGLIKAAKKCLSSYSYVKDAYPLVKYAQQCNRSQSKPVPFRSTVAEVIAALSDLSLIKKKATPIFHNKDTKEATPLMLYSPDMPLVILSALAVDKAQTKAEYLEFIKGFYDHCTDEQKKWFSVDPNNIGTKEWLELWYTNEDYKKLWDDNISNPSTWDLFFACAQQNDPIRWGYVTFTLPSKDKAPPKEVQSGDCCEAAIWGILQLILSPGFDSVYTLSLLPKELQSKSLIKKFVERFADHSINDPELRKQQFFEISGPEIKPGREKFEYDGYGLSASIKNILNALNYMFELDAKDFNELGEKLSSEKQLVSFTITDECFENIYGTIVVTVEDLQNNKKRMVPINVGFRHVGVGSTKSEHNGELHDLEQLSEKYSIDKTAFPFSVYFYKKTPGINLFRPFAGKELNNTYLLWGEKDERAVLLRKNVLQLIDFKKVFCTCNELNSGVVKVLAKCADKSPFTELIAQIGATELVEKIRPCGALLPFLTKVHLSWSGFKEDSDALIGVICHGSDGLDFLAKYLARQNSNWSQDKVLVEKLWKLWFWRSDFINMLAGKPGHELVSAFMTFIPRPLFLKNLGFYVHDLGLLVRFLNKRNEWKNDKTAVKELWYPLCLRNDFVGSLYKNPESELCSLFIKFIPLTEIIRDTFDKIKDFEGLFQFLNKSKSDWKSDKLFLPQLWDKLSWNKIFLGDFLANPEHELTQSLMASVPLILVVEALWRSGAGVQAIMQFLEKHNPEWKKDDGLIKEIQNSYDYKLREAFAPIIKITQKKASDLLKKREWLLKERARELELKQRVCNYNQIINTTSLIAEACSWVPGFSSYALAWRFGSLFCQGVKPVGVDSTVQKTACLGLSAWQAWYVSNWFLKSLQK
ncbi:MAG: hypothetical protein UW09_C0003G0168 [candidate division TM6 bacterium GW2011_GWF2_43_87]|nr:MAG: hypothetical protein UW09_C0003G0168 [candidate division TM6 bacterium GW2011_GWF2_43_87]